MQRRNFTQTVLSAALAASLVGVAYAEDTLKIGVLATLEGPFAAGGQDGIRGAELALKQKGGMAGGKKIEFIKGSSDATPDKAVNANAAIGDDCPLGLRLRIQRRDVVQLHRRSEAPARGDRLARS